MSEDDVDCSDGYVTRYDRSRFPAPAKKAIDLEGRIVKDGVRKVVKDRQLALADLVHAIE
jgi:hypothetical protein